MSGAVIHIGFAINNNYAKYMACTMASILANLADGRTVFFHIIAADLSRENKRRIETLRSIRPFDIEYITADTEKARLLPPNHNAHVSAETNFRLEICSLKPELDKILFLDVDLIVNTDISVLWDMDISSFCAACTPDAPNYVGNNERFKEQAGLQEYYNTGVCLMNLARCRREGLEERIKQAAQTQSGILRFPDQDLLNIAFRGNVFSLSHCWNVMVMAIDWFFPPELVRQTRANPLILHWAGEHKPWSEPDYRYADLFWKYSQMTPFFADILFANISGGEKLGKLSLRSVSASTELLKACVSFSKTKKKYYLYKILSQISLGKKRREYKQKRDILHRQIRLVRHFLAQ